MSQVHVLNILWNIGDGNAMTKMRNVRYAWRFSLGILHVLTTRDKEMMGYKALVCGRKKEGEKRVGDGHEDSGMVL
jgi:hypothetical protein